MVNQHHLASPRQTIHSKLLLTFLFLISISLSSSSHKSGPRCASPLSSLRLATAHSRSLAMAPKPQLGLFSVLSLLAISSALLLTAPEPEPQPHDPTAYDVLPKFGLPGGLLPDSVTSYSLSPDGRFVVFLEGPCYVQFEYLIYYEDRITGKISYGSITELEGIQVQRFFIWFDVNEIRVDLPPSDSIYFQVGFINKKLDLDQFKTVHSCQDHISNPCQKQWSRVLKLPAPVSETPMVKSE